MDKIELQELIDEVTYLRKTNIRNEDLIKKLEAENDVLRLQISVMRSNEDVIQRMLTKEILKNGKIKTTT